MNHSKNENTLEEIDNEYEEFKPKKIIWKENLEYQKMTAHVLNELLTKYDEPEFLPSLAEMSSNMLAICAEKCFEVKISKPPPTTQTPRFSKPIREAYHNHSLVCSRWRKAGRPNLSEHPAKSAKLKSQRLLQKLLRDEEANKARAQHDELMETHDQNISDLSSKLKKIINENVESQTFQK